MPGRQSASDPHEAPAFASVAEALGLGMVFQIRADADGIGRRFTYVSPNCEALNGVSADAALADPDLLYGMILPEERERFARAEAQALAGDGRFQLEVQMRLPGGEVRWRRIASARRVLADGASLWDGLLSDVTDIREAEERRSLVMGELAHRAKNGLQVMMAMVAETARAAPDVKALEDTLIARLQAMAEAQDLVTASGGRPVLLFDLATRALAPFGMTRFDLQPGIEALSVGGDVASGLALLLHEMATNAVKYGALSRPKGKVSLTAEGAGPGMAALQWREHGGPPVEPTSRRGFGSRLLHAALRQQGGKVEPAFNPEGFSARMEFRIGG